MTKRPPNPKLPEFVHDWTTPALIATQGLPGSGKSTWAQEMERRHYPMVMRCNRDAIRIELGFIYDPKRENEVTRLQELRIEQSLAKGLTVIVDDTHLNQKYIEARMRMATRFDVPFKLNASFMEVPVWTCIARDRTRGEHSVGKDVIEELYYRYWSFQEKPLNKDLAYHSDRHDPREERTAIICDLDGTLAMIPKGANTYKRDFSQDEVNPAVLSLLDAIHTESLVDEKYTAILITSGREMADYEASREWLVDNQVPFDKLIMRDTGDSRPDTIVKKELYLRHIQGQARVIYVVDDRPSVVRMWRGELGLTVFQPAANIEF